MRPRHNIFCSKPFEWFEITQLNDRGGVYLCCPSWLDTCIGNIRHASVDEIWNGEKARNIRASILDGSFQYCDSKNCAFQQTRSGPVQNIRAVSDPKLQDVIRKKLTRLPYGPGKIICTYDQSCNLSCPTCRNGIIVETGSRDEILAIEEKIRKQALGQAEMLYITGSGDPFGSPFFRKWLQSMRKQEMPNLKEICLHTNGMLWTPRLWDTIPEDIQSLVTAAEISIDAATKEVYAINRRGGDFNRLLDSLAFISSLRQNGPIKSVKISMVVQENNYRSMPDFVQLGRRFRFDHVYFGRLLNWGTFTEADFKKRAVHMTGHPEHKAFQAVLKADVFNDPIADLGNLTRFRNQSTMGRVSNRFRNLLGSLLQ
jgi:molybdenum cofactor biosynthesis enzyme MoaA